MADVADISAAAQPEQLDSTCALHALHETLLPGTIANAAQTPFFRDHWVGHDLSRITRTNFSDLPTIDKEAVRAAGKAAQNRAGVVCNDVFTTGTTGNPLITVRSDREQAFIHDFFTQELRQRPPSLAARGLTFANPYHGHLIRIPSAIHFHRVSIYDAGGFEYGRRTLMQSHDDADVEDQCTVLVGLERCLRAFTLDTLSKFPGGFPPTALRLIISYSHYLTAAWRRRLEETWGALVVDRFSVSEIFGGASQCLGCGWYHFEPFVIPEVIGARSRKTLETGPGLLALTTLFPFQQAQPLVRYLTGDLVEVTQDASCRPGTTSIKPLGRARYGVAEPRGDGWLVTPASVVEAVDEIADVERVPRFAGIDQVRDPFAIGYPKYRTSAQNTSGRTVIRIEVVLAQGLSEARRVEICEEIRCAVTRQNAPLQQALLTGTASIAVEPCEDVEPDLISQAHSGGVWSQA